MKCILAPFNPKSVADYFDSDIKLPNINLTASSINNIVKGLLDSGEQLLVVTTSMEDKADAIFTIPNLTIVVVGCYKPFILCRLFPDLQSIAKKIYNAILPYEKEVSLFHAHWCYEFALAALKFKNETPIFCTVRDWAPVIYRSILPFHSIYSFISKFYWRYKISIMNEVLSNSRISFIANSEYTYNLLLEYGIQSYIIHNSISEDWILDTLPCIDDRTNIVSIAGSIDDNRKNIKSLISAFEIINKSYPNIRLVLIGDYHQDKGIYKIVKERNLLSSVIFTGRLERKDVLTQIDSSFCMIHPAMEETFGNILIEAMGRGVFCIGGVSSGAVPFVLGKGKFGITCDIQSPDAIAEAFETLRNDTSQFETMRNNALYSVRGSYSNDIITNKHLKLYQQILLHTL